MPDGNEDIGQALWVHNANNCWSADDLGDQLNGDPDFVNAEGTHFYEVQIDGRNVTVYQGRNGRYVDSAVFSPQYPGLTRAELDGFDQRISGARNRAEADQARWERYDLNQRRRDPNDTGNPNDDLLTREQWDPINERAYANRLLGEARENQSRNTLNEELGNDVQLSNNNSSGNIETYRTPNGNSTRPDSIGRDANGNITHIHEHKNVNGDPPVVYRTDQIEGQQNAARDRGATHVLTISSDAGLNADGKPIARPSRNFDNTSEIYYHDPVSNRNTHKWNPAQQSWTKIT